tara:strand:- start:486 stop:1187 length:702 start_codon:yes stop_codon:yes gene_type:complete
MDELNFTVIIPFYNEENTLRQAVNNLLSENFANEILLVDDGSFDKSVQIATDLERNNKIIKLIKSNKNMGKGHALRIGINESKGVYLGVLDADLEYSPSDLNKLFMHIKNEELEVVCGSRFIGDNTRNNKYLRTYIANKFLSNLFSFIYKKKVTDIATCLKVFKKEILENIRFESNGFSIEVELLAKTLSISEKYKEYPIGYSARSYKDGKKIKFIDGFRYVISIFKFRSQQK